MTVITLIFHISNKERAKLSINDAFLWTTEFKEHMQEDLVTASASQSLEKVPLVLPVVHALKSHTKYAGHCRCGSGHLVPAWPHTRASQFMRYSHSKFLSRSAWGPRLHHPPVNRCFWESHSLYSHSQYSLKLSSPQTLHCPTRVLVNTILYTTTPVRSILWGR